MRKSAYLIILLTLACFGCGAKKPVTPAPPAIGSQTAIGDSITRAFNGHGCSLNDTGCYTCTNGDEPDSSWTTGNDSLNAQGYKNDRVVSHNEKISRANGYKIPTKEDIAVSGSTMLADFYNQAVQASDWLITQPPTRYVTIWMAHNDICAGRINKAGNVCDNADQDPENHCRTTEFAFEREFRRGLDELVPVPNIKIGIAAPVRVSQLCHLRNEQACGLFTIFDTCLNTWNGMAGSQFYANGICKTLTADCSKERIIDTYKISLAYRNILLRVSAEYAAYPQGMTPRNKAFGTGGVFKEGDVDIRYSDGPWFYKFNAQDVNCCDCFHPSKIGQNKASEFLWDGLKCSEADPCCDDSIPEDSVLNRGLCENAEMSELYPGFFK
jgi:hypothetical protein